MATEPTPTAPAAEISPPPPPKAATWPEWFGGADLAMALLVAIAAFLIGSFTARNSDLWFHLAAGRQIATGASSFGSEPFSYAAADRGWVNPAWAWDLVAYWLYQSDSSGARLVMIKAIAFALAFVVVMLIRKPGQALWPWAVFGALAVLAAGPYTVLRPFAVNPLFIALMLFVQFRLDWKPGSWRNPLLLGALTALWSNLEGWFVLAPLIVLTVLIGELLHGLILKGRADATPTVLSIPPMSGLVKSLVIVVVAAMINPHHVGVWQTPAELGWGLPTGLGDDRELLNFVLTPIVETFMNEPARGYNLNGLAYAVLLMTSGLMLAISFGRIRISHFLLWLVFAFLSFQHYTLILIFAPVGAMLAAAYANVFSSGIELKTMAHPPTRVYLLFSGLGRLITVPLALALIPAAWPGWLHPMTTAAWQNRRVAWNIEPDSGLVAAARTIEGWRTSQQLPATARGITPNLDFANYLAWFAPGERVLMNGRVLHHAREFPAFLTLRKALYAQAKRRPDNSLDLKAVRDAMAAAGAEYLVIESTGVRLHPEVQFYLYQEPDLALWHLGGRGFIMGPSSRTSLQFNPVRELLGPDVAKLPDGVALPPLPPSEGFADDFVRIVAPPPPEAEDSAAYRDYGKYLTDRGQALHRMKLFQLMAIGGGLTNITRDVTDPEICLPILSLRAAHTAIHRNPDHPDAHSMLAETAMDSNFMPEISFGNSRDRERTIRAIVGLNRFLARTPRPEHANTRQATQAFQACERLISLYGQTNQLDLMRDRLGDAKKYFDRGVLPGLSLQAREQMAQGNKDAEKQLQQMVEEQNRQWGDRETQVGKVVADASTNYRNANVKGAMKILAALQLNLPGTAIATFEAVPDEDVGKEFGNDAIPVVLAMVETYLRAGLLEKAAAQVNRLSRSIQDMSSDPKTDPRLTAQWRQSLQVVEYRVRLMEGNYRAAGDLWEGMYANQFAPIPAAVKAAAKSQAFVAGQALAGNAATTMLHNPLILAVGQQLVLESEFALNRALLYVLEGKPADAKIRFEQSLSPQGESNLGLPWDPTARQFLRMIAASGRP